MLPSRSQYQKWSLPTKWSFWAAAIGIPAGLISLLLTLWPPSGSNLTSAEHNRLLLQVAQELRYNDEWLTSISQAVQIRSNVFPTGSLKTDGILVLIKWEHDWILRHAYGEEKYIYQHILLLRDLAHRLGSPVSVQSLSRNLRNSGYTLHDVHFLNNFLYWYISPLLKDSLSSRQRYSLGWRGLPGDNFQIIGVAQPAMKHFVYEGKPMFWFIDYLGLID
jgi:hypothetical protein